METIHHGPEKRTYRRGSDRVGFILIEEAVENWTKGGLKVERGGLCNGGATRFLSIQLDTIRSRSNFKNSLLIASAYFPDAKKTSDEYQ
jgi:hypothetical protein